MDDAAICPAVTSGSVAYNFCHVLQNFKSGGSTNHGNGVYAMRGTMIRRRISSMPVGMVIVALAVIALVRLLRCSCSAARRAAARHPMAGPSGPTGRNWPAGGSHKTFSGTHSIDRTDHPRLLSHLMVLPSGRRRGNDGAPRQRANPWLPPQL